MKIIEADPNSPEAIRLMEELSSTLEAITGSSGKNSFDISDVCGPRALFVIAYSEEGSALGCGALRPIDNETAEVKRMYARSKAKGIGSEILNYLEINAKKLGYSAVRLETRLINQLAVIFYQNRGYNRIPNYGKYINRPEAVCFEKSLIHLPSN